MVVKCLDNRGTLFICFFHNHFCQCIGDDIFRERGRINPFRYLILRKHIRHTIMNLTLFHGGLFCQNYVNGISVFNTIETA